MSIFFITGTNTDVGKTIATAALAAQLREAGRKVTVLKPLQTGEPDGAGDKFTVERLTGIPGREFVRYPEPLAPNLSARRAGMRQLGLEEVADAIQALHEELLGVDGSDAVLLVEGAGGLLVRLADDWTLAELAGAVSAPLVVVTSMGLGSLNSAELTVEAATRRGIDVVGLIGGSLEADPDLATALNVEEMPVVTGVPLLGSIPAGAGALDREEFGPAVSGTLNLEPILRRCS